MIIRSNVNFFSIRAHFLSTICFLSIYYRFEWPAPPVMTFWDIWPNKRFYVPVTLMSIRSCFFRGGTFSI